MVILLAPVISHRSCSCFPRLWFLSAFICLLLLFFITSHPPHHHPCLFFSLLSDHPDLNFLHPPGFLIALQRLLCYFFPVLSASLTSMKLVHLLLVLTLDSCDDAWSPQQLFVHTCVIITLGFSQTVNRFVTSKKVFHIYVHTHPLINYSTLRFNCYSAHHLSSFLLHLQSSCCVEGFIQRSRMVSAQT